MILNLNILSVNSGLANIGTQSLNLCVSVSLSWKRRATVPAVWMSVLCVFLCNQEEMKAQLPRYQRLIPRAGQAHAAAAPPVAAGIMPPQQGLPPQQPGMRHPMHGNSETNLYKC